MSKTTVLVPPSDATEGHPVQTSTPASIDYVNKPPHYRRNDIEVIDVLEAYGDQASDGFREHCRLTAIAYLLRAPFKGEKVRDMQKAQWYINRWLKDNEKKN